MEIVKAWYERLGRSVGHRHATTWLCTLFFVESFCFPIPVDPLLALYCMHDRARAYWFAFLATAMSVVGGLTGYAIGALLWDFLGTSVISFILSPENFAWARSLFLSHQRLAVLIAGFTPLPYKAITLSAGFCKLPLGPFVLYSLIGRGARFYLVAYVMRTWGEQMRLFIDRFFAQLLLFACVVVIAFVLFMKS